MAKMTAQDAATRYARGFYFRPDGKYRGWEEYGRAYAEAMVPVFQDLMDHSIDILSIGFLYTTSMGLTAQIELELSDGSLAEWLEWLELSRQDFPPHVKQFFAELRDDAGYRLVVLPDWVSPREVVKIIVNESV